MAGMSDPRDLFLHELGDVLYAENVLVKAQPKLAEEATDEELQLGFEAHLEETRQHVKNIVNEKLVEGDHLYAFDCSVLGAGVYYYTLSTGTGSVTKKFIVVN